ncbi:hypothetical protein KP509_09G093900 [Ceratopteris richardii]|uniref:Uncharacterized protein n=1 Tax=Ceratopteris richardii TaxID=49495 RepID=A0A8T2U6Z7_CERRI|nr:hypothetical protein KP509_09G093900 [Ceratopteris richardii]
MDLYTGVIPTIYRTLRSKCKKPKGYTRLAASKGDMASSSSIASSSLGCNEENFLRSGYGGGQYPDPQEHPQQLQIVKSGGRLTEIKGCGEKSISTFMEADMPGRPVLQITQGGHEEPTSSPFRCLLLLERHGNNENLR